jgi:hypothetical protein
MKTYKKRINMKYLLKLAVIFSVMSLTACSTLNDVVEAKNSGREGTTAVYPVTEAQAWPIAKKVFRCEGADAIEEHRSEGYMLTSSGMNLVSHGTVMGAWIKPLSKGQTEVTVVTKRRISINIATTLTETTFQKRFAKEVAYLKSTHEISRQCEK